VRPERDWLSTSIDGVQVDCGREGVELGRGGGGAGDHCLGAGRSVSQSVSQSVVQAVSGPGLCGLMRPGGCRFSVVLDRTLAHARRVQRAGWSQAGASSRSRGHHTWPQDPSVTRWSRWMWRSSWPRWPTTIAPAPIPPDDDPPTQPGTYGYYHHVVCVQLK
jgi:hypothetical protein